MKAFVLPSVQLAFQKGHQGPDKLRGLLKFGPYQHLLQNEPCFGFVFPAGYREYGNRLYLALKNGIGPLFRGVENTFRFRLSKEQVFHVPVLGIKPNDHQHNARVYADAISDWNDSHTGPTPDLFFVLHPKTPSWMLHTPYYECKARLLQRGILSQSVTFELLDNRAQFGWSAANIALGAFVKLGGIPWVVGGDELERDVIIGIGRAYLFDTVSRQNTGRMAFTACLSARGPLNFLSLAQAQETRSEYLQALREVVATTLEKADSLPSDATSLTVHVPKEMGRDEMDVISQAVDSHIKKTFLQLLVVKVTEESNFFAIDDRFQDGVPRRGTALQTSDRSFMLYTEGRDEKEPWASRLPVALCITPQGKPLAIERSREVLRQINDLSQVNWRGINARAKPISVYYGTLIARFLSHISPEVVNDLYGSEALTTLEERMWFL